MKKTCFLLTGLFFLILFSTQIWAEPFAPVVDVPDDLLKPTNPAAIDAMMTKNSKVPSKEDVGIPPYPKAKIAYTQQPSAANINGKEIQPNHMIFMGTVDPSEEVLSFYRKALSDWEYQEKWGTHIFHEGKGKFELMGESSMTTPHIQVRKAFPKENPLMPEMNTVVEVYYRP